MATPYIPMTPAAPVLERPVAVVGPQFCMPHPIDLSVTSKTLSLTDADFAVTDINGNLVFKVKGKFFSLHDKCALLDSIGNPVVSMQQKIWSAHRRWQVFRGGSTEAKDLLFSLKKSSFFQLRTELDVFLAANTNEGAPDFKIKGSFSERSCAIYLGETNTVLARTRSACVDVIPLFLERPLDLHIDDKDMEISYQTSHYDESACRTEPVVSVHHIPSGITVKCSGERSHFANKMKAFNRLKAKLLMLAMEQGVQDIDKIKSDSSTSLWKHEARRYMFRPHKLVQDVMTGVHLPDLNSVLNGNIEPLIRAHITLRQQARNVVS